MKRFVFFLLCFFSAILFSNHISAQIFSNIDSLRTALKTRPDDTMRVKMMCDLAWDIRQEKPEDAMVSAKNAFDLSNKLDYARGKAKSSRLIGIINRIMGDNSSAIVSIKYSIHIYDSIKDLKGLGESYNSLGEVYRITDDYANALTNYQSSLDIFQKLGDKKNIALAENNIGIIYYNQEKFDNALTQYEEALKIRKEIDDKRGISISLNNIANVYGKKKDYDKSLSYQNDALQINREMKFSQGVGLSMINIGELYALKNENEKGLVYYDSSLVIFSQIKDSANIVNAIVKIGQAYLELKEMNDAEKNLQQGLLLATRLGLKQQQFFALSGLTDLFAEKKKFSIAYGYMKTLYDLRDSMTNEAKMKQVNELETRYETKEKQQEIEMLSQKNHVQELETQKDQEEINRGKTITYAALGGGLLVVILLFVLLSRYRIKRKANEDLESKNQIIEEKNKNITDSINYAQRIQKALLASESLLEKNLAEYFIFYKPKDIVSGDFYWAANKNGKFFIAACDCTGHGVPGAFMSLLNTTFLNEAILERGMENPAEIFGEVRQRLILTLNPEGSREKTMDGMDATLVVFDPKTNILSFTCANNPLLLIRNGEFHFFAPDKFPVGFYPRENASSEFKSQNCHIQKGDCIYLFTDGYADQFGGPQGKKFKSKELRELLLKIYNLPMKEQFRLMEKNHNEWKGALEQVDDILIIGIRF
jgi:serine phosphatase RsbU (regulator of sigma subunit)